MFASLNRVVTVTYATVKTLFKHFAFYESVDFMFFENIEFKVEYNFNETDFINIQLNSKQKFSAFKTERLDGTNKKSDS